MQKLSYYLRYPNVAASRLLVRYGTWLPDKLFLKIKFHLAMGYKLDLKNPKTFSEKLQWLKLYDHKPEYTIMVDKVKVKEYVASILGEEYIIPTLGVWDDPDKIDFNALPDRFVLKCNHNSGLGMYICKDKKKMNIEKVKEELRKGLKQNYFKGNREWPYKDVPRRIIAEQYIDPAPNVQDLPDYKWFCFNGQPKYCQVIQNRNTKETIDFFDVDWNHQDFIGFAKEAVNADATPARPFNLDTHLRIACELSKGIPFSRIDLYETGQHTYFGEITLYPASGMGELRPNQYNEVLGKMLVLPGENGGGG